MHDGARHEEHLRRAVTALARTAAALAREAGQPVSETVLHEIELHGVLAHPDVAELWAKGRLVKVPEAAIGFASVVPQAAPAHPGPAMKPGAKEQRGLEDEQRLRDLDRACTAAEEADAELARREREFGEAHSAQQGRRGEGGGSGRTGPPPGARAVSAANAGVKSAERALGKARGCRRPGRPRPPGP